MRVRENEVEREREEGNFKVAVPAEYSEEKKYLSTDRKETGESSNRS